MALRKAIVAFALVLAGGSVAGCASSGGSEPPPTRGAATTRFAAGGHVNLVAAGAGSVWTVAASRSGVAVVRLDPRTGELERLRYRGSEEARIRVGHGAVWLADPQTRSVTRIDLSDGERTVTRPFRHGAPQELAVGAAGVWAIDSARPRLVELDPVTAEPRRTVCIGGSRELSDVAVDARWIWLTNGDGGEVIRVSAATGRMIGTPIAVGDAALDVEAVDGRAWVDLDEADQLAKIDAGGRIAARARDNGGEAFAIAIGFGSVWVTNYGADTVTRIDSRTGARVGTPIAVGAAPKGIAAGEGAVWVANAGDRTITRIEP